MEVDSQNSFVRGGRESKQRSRRGGGNENKVLGGRGFNGGRRYIEGKVGLGIAVLKCAEGGGGRLKKNMKGEKTRKIFRRRARILGIF